LQTELESNILYSRNIKNDRVLKLILGVCNGLDHIHRANLAHRDLKPLNILLSDDRQAPVLTDFGSMTEREIKIENSRKSQEIEDWAAQNCSMFYKAPSSRAVFAQDRLGY
jgi:serine/threonine kinase 16